MWNRAVPSCRWISTLGGPPSVGVKVGSVSSYPFHQLMRRHAHMEQMMPEWGGSPVQLHIVEDIPFDVAVGIKQCKQDVTMISYTYLPKLNEIGVRQGKRSSFIPRKLFLFSAPTLTDDRIWLSLQPIFGHGLHISRLWFAGGSRDLWDCKRNLFVVVSFHLHETHWLPHIPGICLYLQLSKSWFLPDWYSGYPTLPQTMKSVYKDWWLRPRFRKKMKSVMAQKLTHGDHISVSIIHLFVVFGGPLQTDICPGLQIKMVVTQFFPLRHEKLKWWDGSRQNGCHMSGHNLLNLMRGL